DEVRHGGQGVESILLGGRLRLRLAEETYGLLREDDGAMAVGFEVDTDIELASSMVEMLHTSGGADDGKLKMLLDVGCASTVGVGGLDNANSEVVFETGGADEVADEGSVEGGD